MYEIFKYINFILTATYDFDLVKVKFTIYVDADNFF